MSSDGLGFDRNANAADSPTIKVEIYDQAYTVRSDGDPEYLKQLAEYVDQRMREISSGTLTVDSRKRPESCCGCSRQLLAQSRPSERPISVRQLPGVEQTSTRVAATPTSS